MRTWFHPAPDHAKRVVRFSANISCWNPYSDFPRMVENNIAKYISQLRRQLEIYSRSYDSKGYGIGLVADSPTRILQRSPKLVCNVDTASPWFRDLFSSHVTSECNRNACTWSRCIVMVNVRYAPYFVSMNYDYEIKLTIQHLKLSTFCNKRHQIASPNKSRYYWLHHRNINQALK